MLLWVHASAGTGPGSDVLAVCCQWITPTVQLQEAQAVLAVDSQPAPSCCCAAAGHWGTSVQLLSSLSGW